MRVASSTDRCIGRGVRVVLLGGFAVYVVTAIWVWCVCHMIISIYLSTGFARARPMDTAPQTRLFRSSASLARRNCAVMPQRAPERIVYDSVRDMPWMRSAPSPTSQAGWSIQFDRCTRPETPLIRCQAPPHQRAASVPTGALGMLGGETSHCTRPTAQYPARTSRRCTLS
eukprot:scaffold73890_cov61-Phaeocystis_antarctica.AAC.2